MLWCCVLEHFATSSGALLAFLSALCHVLVVGKLGASLAALITGFRTCVANRHRQRTVTGDDVRRDSADVTAIGTKLHRRDMLLLPGCHQVFTMVMAGMTVHLAIGAGLCAVVEMVVMMVGLFGSLSRDLRAQNGRRGA
jgi:hypothetical protein